MLPMEHASVARVLCRREILLLGLAIPCLSACRPRAQEEVDPEQGGRFKGIGGAEMIVDAVEGPEFEGVQFFDHTGSYVFSSFVVSKSVKSGMAYGSPIPEFIHVVWRTDATGILGGPVGRMTYEGPIAGDYIVPVAPRIPDTVLDEIRANGGGLRLKFRLKPDGMLFGWDIVRIERIPGCDPSQNLTCFGTVISSPGGDFLETRY